MSSRVEAERNVSDFVQLLRKFLTAYTELTEVLGASGDDRLSFDGLRALVGDDDGSVLYRLKEKSHALFRSGEVTSASVRREVLFDLAVGSLFHEAMTLRESLYQREVYAPRVEALRSVAGDDEAELFREFDRILDRTTSRLDEVVSEVRDLLVRTRDQLRLLLVERAEVREVTRCLLRRRTQVDATFPEGFEGLLTTMHGDFSTGLIAASYALVDSAYFVDALKTLHEAARQSPSPRADIDHLSCYAEGMQAFLDGDYPASIAALEAWVDLGAHRTETDFAERAGAALGRLDRLVENEAAAGDMVSAAKQLQSQLEAASG